MAVIEISTTLEAPAADVWREVQTPRLLHYVARGRMSFAPIDPPVFPEVWEEREYVVAMRWGGFLPIGRQVIGIEKPAAEGSALFVRDNGRSALIDKWDHLITIRPTGEMRTSYTDRLDVEAGALTPFVAAFAKSFYAHRQRRWERLIANGFDYDL
ncbi:MAG: hypothetical protein AAFR11_12495 [Pseudomonadota bacterium]